METPVLENQLATFGARLKALRLERRWSLDELARRCGLSKGYLSRLESADRQASISAVLTLSRLFGVSLAALFDEQTEAPVIVVRGERTPSHRVDGLTCWPLSARAQPLQLQPLRVLVAPNRAGEERRQHDGEEWIYVLTGKLTLLAGDHAHDLEAGDAAHFDARLPHRLVARGGRAAELLVVAAPARSRAGPPAPWAHPFLSVKTPRSIRSAQARLPQPDQDHEPGN
jgi:transcriptional regulator with XRE-family HTH domain